MSESIPFIDKSYLYDLLSFDAFEVIGSAIGAVAFLFALNKGDQKKLAEILGSMGITTIASANPIMAIIVVLLVGYSYFVKKHKLEKKALAKGAAIASTSVVIFAILGLPLLVELGIAIVVTMLIRKHIVDNEELLLLVKTRMVIMSESTKQSAKKFQQNITFLNNKMIEGLKGKSKFVVSWMPYRTKALTE